MLPHETRVSAGIFVGLLFLLSVLSVTPIDQAAAEDVVSTIDTQGVPYGVDVNQKTGMVYATDFELPGGIFIIDGSTDQIVGGVVTGLLPIAVSVNPTTNTVYVADYAGSDVAVINGSTNELVAYVQNIRFPGALLADPATDRVYVSGVIDLRVTVIDGSTNTEIGTIDEGCGPVHAFALDPATDTIYATTSFNGYGGSLEGCVLAINGQTGTIAKEIFLGRDTNPSAIAVDTRTNMIYVGDSIRPLVYEINGSTNVFVGRLTVPDRYIDGIAITPATDTLYASHTYSNRISVFDLANGTLLTSLTAQGRNSGIALNAATDKVYVTDVSDGELYVISAAVPSTSQSACGAG